MVEPKVRLPVPHPQPVRICLTESQGRVAINDGLHSEPELQKSAHSYLFEFVRKSMIINDRNLSAQLFATYKGNLAPRLVSDSCGGTD